LAKKKKKKMVEGTPRTGGAEDPWSAAVAAAFADKFC
jgi:hypothetical protein